MANDTQATGTIAILGATAVAVVAVLLGVLYWVRSEPPVGQNAAPAESAAKPPVQAQTPQTQAASKPSEPPAPPAEAPIAPSFDVVRVEPSGESVIAGRAAPGAMIELLRGDQVHARAVADASGLFAIVPPPLPPGSHQVVLQSIAPDGARQRSRESVTVVINTDKSRPLVALTAPDKPTVLLSNPEPPETKMPEEPKPATQAAEAKPAEVPAQAAPQQQANAAPETPQAQQPAHRPDIKIVSVETEEGKLFVSGLSAPGATVRLYLNEAFIAPGGAGGDGKVSFSIGSGVKPGDYRIRLDDVDPVSGQVKSRAEVNFNVPVQVASARPVQTPAPTVQAGSSTPSAPAASGKTASADPQMMVGTVVVPNINTAIVSRGDNLWRISQRIYGKGYRYTEIYGANQKQIRNPDLIYPGQIFVLPGEQEQKTN